MTGTAHSRRNVPRPGPEGVHEDPAEVTPSQVAGRLLAILLVEDNCVNRDVASRLLERLGYTCDHAASGEEALAKALERPYDMVFMDVQMPGMDGLQATQTMRRLLGPRTPYIIAMTANGLPGDRERCMEAGMDDYLVKPARLEAWARVMAPPGETA
ncbi:MAG: response regulator [Thermoplasmatota archaeon]